MLKVMNSHAFRHYVSDITILLCLMLSTQLMASQNTVLNQINQAMANKQFQTAVELCLAHEFEFAGITQFDYACGNALINNQQSNIAVQVLQRVLDIDPDFAPARFSIAMALYQVGDYQRAKYHFENLKALNPPSDITLKIDQYLNAIKQHSKEYTPFLLSFIEMSAGYDSNANAAADQQAFLGFALTSENIESESSYFALTGGLYYEHPINADWRFNTRANVSNRQNPSASFVDMSRADGSFQIARKMHFGRIYGQGSFMVLALDSQFNNRKYSLDAGIDYALSPSYTLNFNTTLQDKSYSNSLTIRDGQKIGASTNLIYHYDNGFDQVMFNLGFFQEEADDPLSPYTNHQSQFQFYSRHLVSDSSYLQLQASAINTLYDEDNLFFGLRREDETYAASISYHLNNHFAKNWQTSFVLTGVRHHANVALYQYDRIQLGINLKKTFE